MKSLLRFNISVTDRLKAIRAILSIALLITLAFTWPLWSSDRYYPLFPGIATFPAVNIVIAYLIPSLLTLCLILVILIRRPRFFVILSVVLCATLLFLDQGRASYWFCFYTFMLLILSGFNWRIDNIHHYSSFYNAVRFSLCAVYVVAFIQHLHSTFMHEEWPLFTRSFEGFCTPEQCAYIGKAGITIPFIEAFIIIGLFLRPIKTAAVSFAVLLHLFSFFVLLKQPDPEPAVLVWQFAMIFLVVFAFAGKYGGQKTYAFSLNFYTSFTCLVFGLLLPAWLYLNDFPLKNRIDLMQTNHHEQYIYVTEQNEKNLPLFVRSFVTGKEKNYGKLSVTQWALFETNTKQILGTRHLTQLAGELNRSYGTEVLVYLPGSVNNPLAAK